MVVQSCDPRLAWVDALAGKKADRKTKQVCYIIMINKKVFIYSFLNMDFRTSSSLGILI